MAQIHDDVADFIADQITSIGLSLNGTTEYEHAAYESQEATYGAADEGVANLTNAPLEFEGEAMAGPFTHLVFKREDPGDPPNEEIYAIRPVTGDPASFNSDGRLDVTAAPISSDFAA